MYEEEKTQAETLQLPSKIARVLPPNQFKFTPGRFQTEKCTQGKLIEHEKDMQQTLKIGVDKFKIARRTNKGKHPLRNSDVLALLDKFR